MTTSENPRVHLLSHFRRHLASDVLHEEAKESARRWWVRKGWSDVHPNLEPYTREDMWLDQLGQLPSEEQVQRLVDLLRSPELRELTKGVISGSSTACRTGDLLEVAKTINDWIATTEEVIESRRRSRYILAARQHQGPLPGGKEA